MAEIDLAKIAEKKTMTDWIFDYCLTNLTEMVVSWPRAGLGCLKMAMVYLASRETMYFVLAYSLLKRLQRG